MQTSDRGTEQGTEPGAEQRTGQTREGAVQLPNERQLDLVALRALAHPLRVEILDTLSTYGHFTASGLGERLGESSGATSYHLRQLEKHGFVREVEGKGTGRERWWERTPGSINIGSDEAIATPAGRSAANMIYRQMRHNQDRMLNDFVERGPDELSAEWLDGSAISSLNTRLTPEQMRQFVEEFMKLVDRYIIPNKNQQVPNSRPVLVNFVTIPVIDGTVIGEDHTLQNP
jgi:DNA-binding transcriptional ArsR family regulator